MPRSRVRDCNICEKSKPLDSFYIRTDGSLFSQCKDCRKEKVKISRRSRDENIPGYRKERLLKKKLYDMQMREKDPLFLRKKSLWNYYRMTLEQYEMMLINQEGVCAICKEPPTLANTKGKGFLEVDHDHSCCSTKKSCGECIRGLLCNPCNVGIGRFRDNPEKLMAAIEYLVGDKNA